MEKDTKAIIAIALAASIFVACIASYALLMHQRRITSSGVLTYGAIDVYWDVNCTSKVTHIDWGICEPNETYTTTVYVQNEGTEDVNITITTNNWYPETEYITFRAANFTLPVDTALPVDFSLEISPYIRFIKYFYFDIIVTAG